MAGPTLEKVQLDASVGHPGQRRMSQAVPHEAGQPRSSTNSSHPVASRRVAVVITLHEDQPSDEHPWPSPPLADSTNPDRRPLLLISGELDHSVPWAIVNASYKQQQDNQGVTEIEKIPGHGHALIIDSAGVRPPTRRSRSSGGSSRADPPRRRRAQAVGRDPCRTVYSPRLSNLP